MELKAKRLELELELEDQGVKRKEFRDNGIEGAEGKRAGGEKQEGIAIYMTIFLLFFSETSRRWSVQSVY